MGLVLQVAEYKCAWSEGGNRRGSDNIIYNDLDLGIVIKLFSLYILYMLSVLEAQHRARRDPDALIAQLNRNIMVARLMREEFIERKCPLDISAPIRQTDDCLDASWSSLMSGNGNGASILSSFTNQNRKDFDTLDIKRLLDGFAIDTIFDPLMGHGSNLLAACSIGAKAYIGVANDDSRAFTFHELKTFIERKNGANTFISLYFRDALTLPMTLMTYDCVFMLDHDVMLSELAELQGNAANITTCEFVKLAEKAWEALPASGFFAICHTPLLLEHLTQLFGEPVRTQEHESCCVCLFQKKEPLDTQNKKLEYTL